MSGSIFTNNSAGQKLGIPAITKASCQRFNLRPPTKRLTECVNFPNAGAVCLCFVLHFSNLLSV